MNSWSRFSLEISPASLLKKWKVFPWNRLQKPSTCILYSSAALCCLPLPPLSRFSLCLCSHKMLNMMQQNSYLQDTHYIFWCPFFYILYLITKGTRTIPFLVRHTQILLYKRQRHTKMNCVKIHRIVFNSKSSSANSYLHLTYNMHTLKLRNILQMSTLKWTAHRLHLDEYRQ